MSNNLKWDEKSNDDLAKMILESEVWLVLRLDEQGLHLHLKNGESQSLIPYFLCTQPDFYKMVVQFVNDYKKGKIDINLN